MTDLTARQNPTGKEARAIMAAGLGKAELEFATSVTAPLYWVKHKDLIRQAEGLALSPL
jgi:hypothetical protein